MTSKQLTEPKDLGVKIGSKEEVFWTDVKEKAEQDILNNKHAIVINEGIIVIAEAKIAEEKESFK